MTAEIAWGPFHIWTSIIGVISAIGIPILVIWWNEINTKFRMKNHSKKNITSDRCYICGAPNKGYRNCGVCEEAKKIANLEDLREWAEKQRIPPREESLVKAINFYQKSEFEHKVDEYREKVIDPKWYQPKKEGTIIKGCEFKSNYVKSAFLEFNGDTPPLPKPRPLTREEIANIKDHELRSALLSDYDRILRVNDVAKESVRVYKYYDMLDDKVKPIRIELPRPMTEQEAKEWIKLNEPRARELEYDNDSS